MSAELEHTQIIAKQALQQQSMEIDMALKELVDAKSAYRFVGGLLVASDVDALRADLTKKKESVAARLSSMQKRS